MALGKRSLSLQTKSQRRRYGKSIVAVAVGSMGLAVRAFAGTTVDPNTGVTMSTISVSGSTALKGFITTGGFTFLEPGTTINLSNGVFGPNSWATYNSQNQQTGGTATSFQLAPKVLSSGDVGGIGSSSTATAQSADALRIEYHESGSVEGILELANDQIGPVGYIQNSVDRNPNGGNAVWVNGNQIGGVGAPQGNVIGATANGYYLGPEYGTNADGSIKSYGAGVQPTFNTSGGNTSYIAAGSYAQAGQNAVQLAVSDVVPQQAFTNDYSSSSTASSLPWMSTPTNFGYGQGNTKLSSGGLGIAGGDVSLQSSSTLNMLAGHTSPTGTTFTAGPWNSAGLGNVDSQRLAVTGTLFVANPGTGLDRLDKSDAQWLQTTGRLSNGARFEMTTRDVNSGTRNVAALNTGIDPSWATGVNDDGNGNAFNASSASAVTAQISIGSGMRFSNKTAGGAQLLPTVQNDRMAVGTLSEGDSDSNFKVGNAYPIRALEYSNSTDGSSNYVLTSAHNLVNGDYAIYQNEQLVTLKAPTAADASLSVSQWSALGTGNQTGQVAALGDNTGDVIAVRNNALNTVTGFNSQNTGTQQYQQLINTLGNSSFSLITKGFILPQFMQVEKPMDGAASTANPVYDSTLSGLFVANYASYTTASAPDTVTATTGDKYGFSSKSNSSEFGSYGIPITTNGNGGNWLFGNFNQNGIRDFDSVVVTAEQALGVLEASGLGTSSLDATQVNNHTALPTGSFVIGGNTYTLPSALATMNSGAPATKGDLIVMGDFDGRGVFDGKSLYELAVGASIADASSSPTSTGFASVSNDHLTLKSETNVTVENADGSTTAQTSQTFGDAVRSGKLFKNTALDYLNTYATAQMKSEAAAVLTVGSGSTSAAVPAGATYVGNDAVSGLAQYRFDYSGINAFNKSDVNRDGVVDFNDAVLVDQYSGKDYTSQTDTLTAVEPAPVTGLSQPADLVLIKQSDSSTVIGPGDLAVINSALTGAGNTNWYAYTVNKTGTGTITFNRSGGTVRVFSNTTLGGSAGTGAAAFNIASGSVVIESALDPFTDSSAVAGTGTAQSVAVSIASGATLEYTPAGIASVQTDKLSTLTVASGGHVTLDSSTSQPDHILLIVGSLNLGGSADLDLGSNEMLIKSTSLAAVTAELGSEITSSKITATSLTTLAAVTGASVAATFDGVTPAAGDVIVKYTYYGDANLDGAVDGSDYTLIDNGFNNHLTGWANGDFNYDGVIDGSDYTLIDNTFNTQGGSLGYNPAVQIATSTSQVAGGSTSSVPEPVMLPVLAVLIGGMLGRHRQRSQA